MDYQNLPKAHILEHFGNRVLDSRIISTNGVFRKVVMWLPGHINLPGAKFIKGWSGPETEIIFNSISPSVVFEVLPGTFGDPRLRRAA